METQRSICTFEFDAEKMSEAWLCVKNEILSIFNSFPCFSDGKTNALSVFFLERTVPFKLNFSESFPGLFAGEELVSNCWMSLRKDLHLPRYSTEVFPGHFFHPDDYDHEFIHGVSRFQEMLGEVCFRENGKALNVAFVIDTYFDFVSSQLIDAYHESGQSFAGLREYVLESDLLLFELDLFRRALKLLSMNWECEVESRLMELEDLAKSPGGLHGILN